MSDDAPGSRALSSAHADIHASGFTVDRVIGMGGFGIVLAATRHCDGARVALKTIHRADPTDSERLRREADALRTIGPPHVPEFFSLGVLDDGRPYFAFEHLIVPSLASRLGEPLSAATIAQLARPVCDAVAAAHRHGLIHRDIKPDNLFVDDPPTVAKIIDFGLAKKVEKGAGERDLTIAGMFLGTTMYMSPEQCEGRLDVDTRADIYALGIVLYEMLTGKPPFRGKPADIRIAHVSHRPVPPSRHTPVAAEVDAVILRCLAKQPSQRYPDIDGLRRALLPALKRPVPTLATPSEVSELDAARRRPRSRHLSAGSPQVLAGVVFFHSDEGRAQVTRAIERLGGVIPVIEGRRYAAVFAAHTGWNPLEQALEAALDLVERGLVDRAIVDRERVRMIRGRHGSVRLISANLHRKERFPSAETPGGILLTRAVADSLGLPVRTLPQPADVSVERAGSDSGEVESERASDVELVLLLSSASRVGPADSDGPAELVGRDSLITELLHLAESAASTTTTSLVSLVAEPGHGKSSLAAALAAALRAREQSPIVIHLRARDSLRSDRDETLRSLLCSGLRLPNSASAEIARAALLDVVGEESGARLWPAVALACGWLSATHPDVVKLRAAPTALRSAAAEATGEALRALCAQEPVCCIIDDAHLADDTSLDALEYATLFNTAAPLFVCVLARPEFVVARPAWGTRAGRHRTLQIGPLTEDHATVLCRRLLQPARDVPASIVASLVERSAGNPLFLCELVRGIKHKGLIRRHGRGQGYYLAADELDDMPELLAIEWLAEYQLGALPHELANHARMLALLPSMFTIAEVDGILRQLEREGLGALFPLDAGVSVQRLCEQTLLVANGLARYEFRHTLIREQVARLVADHTCQHVHRASFRYYQHASHLTDERRLPLLAYHASRCGLDELATNLYLQLAERAQSVQHYVDAARLYSRALELLTSDASHARARLRARAGRAVMQYRLSRFDDALVDLHQAQTIARALSDDHTRAGLLLDEATVLDWLRDFATSKARVEEARYLAESGAQSPLVQARLALGLGRAKHRANDNYSARNLLEKAAEQAAALGDDGYETQVIALMLLGYALSVQGDIGRAMATYERCIQLCEARGDKLHLAAVLNNRSLLWLSQQSPENAASDALRSQHLGREIGQLSVEYTTSINLAELYYFTGNVEAAAPHAGRAAELEQLTADKPTSRLLGARIALLGGDWSHARDELIEIRAAQERAHAAGSTLMSPSDQVLLDMIEYALEGAPESAWSALGERAAGVCEPVEWIEVVEAAGLSALRAGDGVRAHRHLQRALVMSRECAHVIEQRLRAHLDDFAAR